MEYEALAKERLPAEVFDFITGGAGDELTVRENRAAFERVTLRPRVLVDVSRVDTSTEVLGQRVAMPVLVAPMGTQRLAHPEGEFATARAAAAAGTVFVIGTTASCTFEEVAEAGGQRWLQLYVFSRDIAQRLIERAEASGYSAVCVTVDSPQIGRRERDLRNGMRIPTEAMPGNLQRDDFPASGHNPAVTWDDIDWLRSLTSLPMLLKGIVTAEDARIAVEHGVEGIVVSNHGGRQLDGCIATLDALPEVVDAVAGRAEVLLDGGVRRGTDVLKAIALGAKAVLVGRPIMWGLAADGEDGARHVLKLLHRELENAMALSGRTCVAQIDRSLVRTT